MTAKHAPYTTAPASATCLICERVEDAVFISGCCEGASFQHDAIHQCPDPVREPSLHGRLHRARMVPASGYLQNDVDLQGVVAAWFLFRGYLQRTHPEAPYVRLFSTCKPLTHVGQDKLLQRMNCGQRRTDEQDERLTRCHPTSRFACGKRCRAVIIISRRRSCT